MHLSYTDEQEALREAARRALTPPSEGRPASVAGPDSWPMVAELGWLGVAVPEHAGGVGLGLLEETILAEETAAELLAAPWFSTVAGAVPILQAAEDARLAGVVSGALRATLATAEPGTTTTSAAVPELPTAVLGTVAASTDSTTTLTGTKLWVADAESADLLLVTAESGGGPALYVVDSAATSVETRAQTTFDATRPLAEVILADAPAQLLVGPERTPALLINVGRRALTLAAAEAVGVARRTLDLAVKYAGSREQFGRLIGTYQGISHKLTDRYVALELSRSLVLWAALTMDAGDDDAEVAVRAAAAKALPEAVTTCEQAIQVFGGVGTTWETPLHRYYRRAIALVAYSGPPTRHRAVVADILLPDAPAAPQRRPLTGAKPDPGR
jgi:alkylation response protein AidB-like acyl-CoA dehydrogenase